eukprot:15040-Pelagomonas_calceolata.AAC.1
MRDSWIRAYKSLKLSHELFQPGFSLMVLAPLPVTKATLLLSLCALSQADKLTLIPLRSLLKTETSTLLN